ncbi:hypothetical protein FC40_GL001197 [Ligilactobacillus hayakitensis DSM 18933 = JCM 14209]|uniref:Uncharacterized protein n=2 Tax=Ligilactobacillus TaxID=2767887 RepID=A0A0R1WM43_9LACO|nr:hypothetical protein FC40_GL001197 [Ligilactobacillus hayakitensis DSM 18933 = JCM 14209]
MEEINPQKKAQQAFELDMASYLQVQQASNESKTQFQYRLVYSALAKQLLTNLESDAMDYEVNQGVSKRLLKKIMQALMESFGSLYPNLKPYLNEALYFELLDNYLALGSVYDAKRRYELQNFMVCGDDKLSLVTGNIISKNLLMSGQGLVYLKEMPKKVRQDFSVMFNLQEVTPSKFYQYLKQLPLVENQYLANNPQLRYLNGANSPTDWWQKTPPRTLTLAKRGDDKQASYYLYEENRFYALDATLIESMGYEPYLWAVLSSFGIKPQIEEVQTDDLVTFKVPALFPMGETALLKAYSWPVLNQGDLRVMDKRVFEYLMDNLKLLV